MKYKHPKSLLIIYFLKSIYNPIIIITLANTLLNTTLDKLRAIFEPNKPPIKKPMQTKAATLDLELINKNRLNDNELMDLGERLTLFARDLLKRKKSTCLREFMDKAKNHLTGDMLSMVKDEIELSKVKVD